jgi:hypothetical protein
MRAASTAHDVSTGGIVEPRELTQPRPLAGRLSEFLLVGGLTPLLFPLAWLFRRSVGLDESVYAVSFTMFYAAHVLNDPHFAVTYVLFYKDVRARALGAAFAPRQRLRYLVAGFAVPLLLGGWAIAALSTRSSTSLSLLIQLMFLLVGWHYVKQGFGILTVLGARRGVRFHAYERLAILAHCYTGWAYAWASPFDPGRELEEKGLVYRTIAHPVWLEPLTKVAFLATIAPLIYVLVQKHRREGRLPLITPLTGFLCSVWAWSIYSSIDPLVRYVIPALHSLQYLYIVWLLKSNEAREREGPPFFETSAPVRLALLALLALALGVLLFHLAPSVLDDALVDRRDRGSPLGPTPYFAALFAFVNIHHYFMDTVLWRQDNPLTRYLRAAQPDLR